MKTSFSVWFALLFSFVAGPIFAADPPPTTNKPAAAPDWSIRAEGIAVIMPQEKALGWLPDLQEENKIAATVTQILAAVQKKEVTLAGYQVIQTSGEGHIYAESINEKIYPTQFLPPEQPGSSIATPTTAASSIAAFPTAFEKRNVGVTLEIEPQVLDGGKWIQSFCQFQHVFLLGWDKYSGTQFTTGPVVKVKQPNFFAAKSNANLLIHNGAYALVGVHKLEQPEGSMEIFIVHMTAAAREH